MSPQRQRDRVDGLRQMGEHELEGAPGVREAVQKQHRKTEGISPLGVGKPYLVGKLNGLDDKFFDGRYT